MAFVLNAWSCGQVKYRFQKELECQVFRMQMLINQADLQPV